MPGETDLELMLAEMSVAQRPGTFVFALVDGEVRVGDGIDAVVVEDEATTAVVLREVAKRNGWAHHGEFAWLTIEVHSSLEAVGLTAAFSAALTTHRVPCNVIAGYHHDHLLVPVDRADEAVEVLTRLS